MVVDEWVFKSWVLFFKNWILDDCSFEIQHFSLARDNFIIKLSRPGLAYRNNIFLFFSGRRQFIRRDIFGSLVIIITDSILLKRSLFWCLALVKWTSIRFEFTSLWIGSGGERSRMFLSWCWSEVYSGKVYFIIQSTKGVSQISQRSSQKFSSFFLPAISRS